MFIYHTRLHTTMYVTVLLCAATVLFSVYEYSLRHTAGSGDYKKRNTPCKNLYFGHLCTKLAQPQYSQFFNNFEESIKATNLGQNL